MVRKTFSEEIGECIAGGGFATTSHRSYCPRKADGFAAAFSGTANNTVVCNRGQYIKLTLRNTKIDLRDHFPRS